MRDIRRRRVSIATTISKINREKRREICREKSGWSINENWKKVIFSDETQVVVGQNKKLFQWRKDEEKYLPQCVGQYGDFERKKIHSCHVLVLCLLQRCEYPLTC